MDKKIRTILYLVYALTAISSVAGIWLLPQTLVVQVTASGAAGNTLPKALALLIGPALCALSWAIARRDDQKGTASALIAAAAAVISQVFLYIVNL